MQASKWRSVGYGLGALLLLTSSVYLGAAEETPSEAVPVATKTPEAKTPEAQYRTESLRGQVVWLADALQRRFGIKAVPEARERILALETEKGPLYPIVEDLRGRSFRTDKRLREMDVELLVRRHAGLPLVQIVRVYEIKNGEKYLVDYWCDVCAIVMFEKGLCACCQDDNRLRKRPVEED